MLPGVDGFAWDLGHIVFLGAFFTVLLVILATISWSLARTARDLREERVAALRWHGAFASLPRADRACRHALAGAVDRRVCANGFACGTCPDHETLAALPARQVPADAACGVELPGDRLYHRGHAWARREEDGTWTVGPDELAERILGAGAALALPPVGARLAANGVAWVARCGRDEVHVLAPIDGEVVATGGRDQGWYVRVRPPEGGPDTRHLLCGDEARAWMAREVQRLLLALREPAIGAALADGGCLAGDLPRSAPAADWQALRGRVLLDP